MIVWTILFYLYYFSEWVIRLSLLTAVTRHHRPASATAWLLVIFLFPWPGLALYLLVGENRLPKRRIERHARFLEEMKEVGRRFEGHPSLARPELSRRLMSVVQLSESLCHLPILGGNAIELISRTEAFIDRLVADIDAARRHAHLLFYIYADDATGRRVTEALERAAKRGVKCRLLVDDVGSRPMLKADGENFAARGIELRRALRVNLFRRRMARLDLRNHRKLAVIDGAIGYAGSQNIIDANYGHKDLSWHDTMVRLTGPGVLELQSVFVGDWFFETEEMLDPDDVFIEPEPAGNIPIQVLPSGPNYPIENYHRVLVDSLHAAEQRVIITTPYFIPDQAFMQAMQVAVLRGVRIDLIAPSRSDQPWVAAASRAYYDDLLEVGVRIHLHTEGLLHAKTVTIDDALALIGSSNMDIRSFELNFEVSVLLYGATAAAELRALQESYLAQSIPLTARSWAERPAIERLFQNIAKLFSPLL